MPFTPGYVPWNKGRCIGQKRPFKIAEVEVIPTALQGRSRLRELGMFNLAIDSKLRGCDLIGIRIEDVLVGFTVRDRASIMQKKTKAPVQFEIGSRARAAGGEAYQVLSGVPRVWDPAFLYPWDCTEFAHL